MFTLHSILLMVHVLISASIIGLVLLQRGKGADAGAAFGAGASGTVFGARGSGNFLSRATAVLATAFFLSSLTLAFLGTRPVQSDSLMNVTSPSAGISSALPGPDEPASGAQPITLSDPLPALPESEGVSGSGDLPAVPEIDSAEEVAP